HARAARRPDHAPPPFPRRRPLSRHAAAGRRRVEPRRHRLPATAGRPTGASTGPAHRNGPAALAPDAPGDPRPLARIRAAAARRLALADPDARLRTGFFVRSGAGNKAEAFRYGVV